MEEMKLFHLPSVGFTGSKNFEALLAGSRQSSHVPPGASTTTQNSSSAVVEQELTSQAALRMQEARTPVQSSCHEQLNELQGGLTGLSFVGATAQTPHPQNIRVPQLGTLQPFADLNTMSSLNSINFSTLPNLGTLSLTNLNVPQPQPQPHSPIAQMEEDNESKMERENSRGSTSSTNSLSRLARNRRTARLRREKKKQEAERLTNQLTEETKKVALLNKKLQVLPTEVQTEYKTIELKTNEEEFYSGCLFCSHVFCFRKHQSDKKTKSKLLTTDEEVILKHYESDHAHDLKTSIVYLGEDLLKIVMNPDELLAHIQRLSDEHSLKSQPFTVFSPHSHSQHEQQEGQERRQSPRNSISESEQSFSFEPSNIPLEQVELSEQYERDENELRIRIGSEIEIEAEEELEAGENCEKNGVVCVPASQMSFAAVKKLSSEEKRRRRLERNAESARLCRQRKKLYIQKIRLQLPLVKRKVRMMSEFLTKYREELNASVVQEKEKDKGVQMKLEAEFGMRIETGMKGLLSSDLLPRSPKLNGWNRSLKKYRRNLTKSQGSEEQLKSFNSQLIQILPRPEEKTDQVDMRSDVSNLGGYSALSHCNVNGLERLANERVAQNTCTSEQDNKTQPTFPVNLDLSATIQQLVELNNCLQQQRQQAQTQSSAGLERHFSRESMEQKQEHSTPSTLLPASVSMLSFPPPAVLPGNLAVPPFNSQFRFQPPTVLQTEAQPQSGAVGVNRPVFRKPDDVDVYEAACALTNLGR